MKLASLFFIGTLFTAAIVIVPRPAEAGCGLLDPTCRSGPNDCLFGSCPRPPRPSQSSVGRDMTPPRVRTARNLVQRGFVCVEVNEFSDTTCRTPQGMNPSEFPVRWESFHSNYLGANRGWAWDCMNRGGQVWGNSRSDLWCEPNMR